MPAIAGPTRILSALVPVAVMLSACAAFQERDPLTRIDPPQLEFQTDPTGIVSRQPVRVEIKNGAGQYIFVGPAGQQSAHPDLSMLDGTLVITTLWSTNELTTQTLTHEPGKPVELGWDDQKKQHYVKSGAKPAAKVAAEPAASRPGLIERVTIQDEAGQSLGSSGSWGSGFESFAHPQGGKLSITAQWSSVALLPDKPETWQTQHQLDYTEADVRYDDEWGPYVEFRWDANAKRFVIEPRRQGAWGIVSGVDLSLGRGTLKHEAPSIGVNVGPDTALLEGPQEIDVTNLHFGAALGRIGPFQSKLGLDLQWGDKTTSSDSASGARGFTFQGGPSAGSPGVAAPDGVRSVANLETRYDAQKVSLNLARPFPGIRQTNESRINKFDQFFFSRSQYRHDGDLRFPLFPNVFAEEDLKVTEYGIGFAVGAAGRHNFGSGVSVSGGVSFDVRHYWGEYKGRHHYVIGANDFTQSTEDSKDGFTWGAGLNVGLHYSLNRRAELSVRADYAYRDKSVFLAPRVTPSGPAPHLRTDSTNSRGLVLALRYPF